MRAEAQNLTVELYRWLKDAMKPLFWGELKPVQQTDLDKLFEKVKDDQPKQERLLRSQQAAVEAAEEAGEAPPEEADEEDAAIDLEPEFEAVDVMAKVPANFSERLASSKWKDRKEALDELHAAANHPAIQEGPFDDVMRGLAKSMKDANVACVTVAANCVELLAKGLRKSFQRYRSTIMSPMLERLKEKKQSVTDALAAACDAVVSATGLTDNLEEILEFFKHKTPQVKLESARVLVRCLKNIREVPPPPELKSMADAAKVLLGDSQAPPREAAAEILGTLWKIMTDRNMLPHLDGLDDMRKNKIKEYCDQADVKVKWKPKAAPPPKPAAAPAAKKAAPGRRPALAAKKAAPAPVRPATPEEPPAAAPLAARPTSRPGSKLAPKSGLAAPGSKMRKPGVAPAAASPRRVPSEDIEMSDEPPTPAPAPRSGLAAPRSLAARPLGRPAASFDQSMNEPPAEHAPPPQAAPSVLSLAERSELSDLRSEAEYLRSQNSELRTDKMRLNSQIHELQNQNAQLIEDHTRDVLGIKAKETQLVRARSDAEAAEERAASLSREVDRLKREVARLGRLEREGQSMDQHNNGYSDNNNVNGMGRYDSNMGNMGPPRPPFGRQAGGLSYSSSREPSGETKDNFDVAAGLERQLSPVSGFRSSNAPSLDHTSSGRASPAFVGLQRSASGSRPGSNLEQSHSAGMGTESGLQRSSMSRTQSGEGGTSATGGVESWRRAAEVTQNLKARIEMMKVSLSHMH